VIGEVYEAETFASVVVHQKIIGYYKKDPDGDHFYKGVLVRQSDVIALKNAGVPYAADEDPSLCEGVVYTFQIRKKVSKGVKPKRKRKVKKKV
jgi:hypothetical protein